jgi:uncharacterized membrane protein
VFSFFKQPAAHQSLEHKAKAPGNHNRRIFKPLSEAYPLYLEIGGVTGLIGLVVFFLAVSWRKWPDALIDFGRELYTPWRLSQGAVLYRDVDDFYGPLSQYFNASLFTCFGPSLMLLATANIIIFIGILTSLYLLCRHAWGVGPALAACAVFISVFGFSQFNPCGNFNYATPYSHETTHGLLVCLLLVLVLVRWVEESALGWSFWAGLLFGLTLVLKPEIALVGGLSLLAAGLAKCRLGTPPGARALAVMGCGAILPTLGFTVYFATHMPWMEAAGAACRAWLNAVATTRFSGDFLELNFVGLDRPWMNFGEQALATLWACLLIALIAAVAWQVERIARKWLQFLSIALLAGGLSWLGFHAIIWGETGRCLPGLMVIYLVACLVSLLGGSSLEKNHRVQITRLLMAVLATALLARMILNARIYHYGYYQAALAAILVPAILMGELPQWIGVGRKGACVIVIGTLALLAPGVVILCARSQEVLALKTLPVGTGGDQFYAFSPNIDPTGELVNAVSQALREAPPRQTLVVLPEGEMINYLARRPSPIAPFIYYAMATAAGGEDRIVEDLGRHPPDWVVIISRGLVEFNIERYGEQPGEGREILSWVNKNYETAASVGGDPLDNRQHGVVLLTRKNALPKDIESE